MYKWSYPRLKSMRHIQITVVHGRVDATPGFWYNQHASVGPCNKIMNVTLVESSMHSLFNVVRASAAWWSHRTFFHTVVISRWPKRILALYIIYKNQNNANLVPRRVEQKQQVCWLDCYSNDWWLWKPRRPKIQSDKCDFFSLAVICLMPEVSNQFRPSSGTLWHNPEGCYACNAFRCK